MFSHPAQLWSSHTPSRIIIWENPSVLSGKLEFLLFRHTRIWDSLVIESDVSFS